MAQITTDQTTSSKPLIESDRVEGTAVYGVNGDSIGSVKRLMIEKVSGKVAYAVVAFGGFLGLGGESYTVPWNKLEYDTSAGGYRTDITEEQLRGSPSFSRERDYNWTDRGRERELHDYWRTPYYWGYLGVPGFLRIGERYHRLGGQPHAGSAQASASLRSRRHVLGRSEVRPLGLRLL